MVRSAIPRVVLWLGMLLSLPGCYRSHAASPSDAAIAEAGIDASVRIDAGTDAGTDSGPAADAPFDGGDDGGDLDAGADASTIDCDGSIRTVVQAALSLDLLFVVDNSGSMAAEQALLAREFPRMVRSLVTGDVDDDGHPDFPPVRDLQVGVVTSDMGALGHRIETCEGSPFGDDGVLRDRRGRNVRGCEANYPSFLTYRAGAPSDGFVEDFGCVAQVGTGGCGLEQPLEAALKALTPATSATRFFADSTGHGDGENAGFLRAESILAVLLITDEDDCSIADPELLDATSSRYTGEIALRCINHEREGLHDIERYYEGLRQLRPDHPERLLFGAIVGVPADLVGDPATIDYGAILSDPRMVPTPNPLWPGMLVPSCEVRLRGQAYPPRRLVRLAERFGDQAIVQSICQASFPTTMGAVLNSLGTRIREVGCGVTTP